ncbi:alginate lyase family protein [Hyunsoonleella jejuensis]|nr:alginate lyase family protein [Hyunsoonleella jejuensis]
MVYHCFKVVAVFIHVSLSVSLGFLDKSKPLLDTCSSDKIELSVLDYTTLLKTKSQIQTPRFHTLYKGLIKKADRALKEGVFSVTQKTQIPPSGDKHDYISYGPYWWPNPNKPDGLPWIRRDGEINPLTRKGNTDFETKSKFFNNTEVLAMAYFFSDKKKYAVKALELIKVWFINEATKMNPNLNYAQGIPGINTGRGIGIIEFSGISKIITAIEILQIKDEMDTETSERLRVWFAEYLLWLQTSDNGVFEKNTKNNHAVYYDMQVVSILLFLNRKQEAKTVLETVKTKRIAQQIEPDGKQPHELERTKALSYSTMNLRGFTQLAFLGTKVDVDLWNYKAENGASIIKAYEFLKPYATGEKEWEYKQITSLDKAKKNLKELFAKAGAQFNEKEYCKIGTSENTKATSLLFNCN